MGCPKEAKEGFVVCSYVLETRTSDRDAVYSPVRKEHASFVLYGRTRHPQSSDPSYCIVQRYIHPLLPTVAPTKLLLPWPCPPLLQQIAAHAQPANNCTQTLRLSQLSWCGATPQPSGFWQDEITIGSCTNTRVVLIPRRLHALCK
jgi:hypothetical protein